MTDSTLNPQTSEISTDLCRAQSAWQWLLEQRGEGVTSGTQLTPDNVLQILVCGQDAFNKIASDIQSAKKSIDLVCWGFDPAMVLDRKIPQWDAQQTYGALLEQAASRGVQIRLLVWYNYMASIKQNNMPGYSDGDFYVPGFHAPGFVSPRVAREAHCTRWYKRVLHGDTPNLELRIRDGQPEAIRNSLASGEQHAPSSEGLLDEKILLERFGTHHQKTILIDYEKPNVGTGYVMGLNSTTDYWDTSAHEIDSPFREPTTDTKELKKGYANKKPYQDYACRIAGGGVLASVQSNFESAWGKAAVIAVPKKRSAAPAPAPGESPAVQPLAGEAPLRSRAQILRTQPEEGEKSIKAFYKHCNEVATDYLYLENQYFFYPEWAEHLKTVRKKWVTDWKNSLKVCKNKNVTEHVQVEDIPALHLFVVMPEPEIDQMVPRTYETLKHLGRETSMRGQRRDEVTDEVLDKNAPEEGQDVLIDSAALQPSAWKASASQVVRDALAIPKNSPAIMKETYSMKTSIAMLYTSGWVNGRMRYRPIYIHSKLLINSDAAFTLGSANLNQRSMAVDSEINLASDCPTTTRALREQVFKLHSGGDVVGGAGSAKVSKAFDDWNGRMSKNKKLRKNNIKLVGFLLPFEEIRTCEARYA